MKKKFHERKKERTEHYEKFVKGWKQRPCGACNGSGRYDHNGSPDCDSCDGTGKELYNPEQERLQLMEFIKTPEGHYFYPVLFKEFIETEEGKEFLKTKEGKAIFENFMTEKWQLNLKSEEERLARQKERELEAALEKRKRGKRYGI